MELAASCLCSDAKVMMKHTCVSYDYILFICLAFGKHVKGGRYVKNVYLLTFVAG